MEPMHIGSSPISPIGPNSIQSSANQYLPGFLLGDSLQSSNNAPSNHITDQQFMRQPGITPVSGSTNQQCLASRCLNQSDRVGRRLTSPPIRSMWSCVTNPTVRKSRVSIDQNDGLKHSTPNTIISTASAYKSLGTDQFMSPSVLSSNRAPTHNIINTSLKLPVSPAHSHNQIINGHLNVLSTDSLADALATNQSTKDVENLNSQDCWVTVFGFPSARSAFILNQFSQFGTIEKHVITNNGNWMHLKYQNRMQSKCALNKNGKVFDNIMVGVAPCTDSQVYSELDSLNTSFPTTACFNDNESLFTSPIASQRPVVENGRTPLREIPEFRSPCFKAMDGIILDKPSSGLGRHNSMRSLAPSNRSNNLSRTTSVRQDRGSGMFSKALGYMFGWS